VPDVEADARYLACSLETRSEIVVPIIKNGSFWGEIDVDSDRPNAFGPDDVEFLEAVARLLPERL
jgi:GAF domain-containing protein